MKTSTNILIAFILNLGFAVLELFGGLWTGSVAIISDSLHDAGDALSIGISFFLEKKSRQKPDDKFTYGYARFSVLGAFITTVILTIGSVIVVIGSINRLFHPAELNYNGMIGFAVFGVITNFAAAFVTKEGDSINQKAVNLHMLEDVLGWSVVLVGSVLMRFTKLDYIDSIMCMGVAVFILIESFQNFKEILDLFLIKLPKDIDLEEIRHHLLEIEGVKDVHHVHVWSTDGVNNYATLHVKTDAEDTHGLKHALKEELSEHKIAHATIELESLDEKCEEECCEVKAGGESGHHHHHHHH